MTCHTSRNWRAVTPNQTVTVKKVESAYTDSEYTPPTTINRQTEEGFALFKERNPTARQCNKDTPFDPSIEGAKWVHMEAREVFDDGENHIEYECIHCGEHYHIYLPD